MAKKITIQKTALQKNELEKVVSREFTTFTQPVEEIETDTVFELFRLYDKLYMDIPLEGDSSHTTLIEESSKLVTFEKDNSDIQPLLDEITNLREQVLEANETIEELEQQISNINII